MLRVAGKLSGHEANGIVPNGAEAAAGAEGAGPAAEGGEHGNHRPTLQQTRSQGSGALGNSAARRVVAGVVDEATGGMNAGEVAWLASPDKPTFCVQAQEASSNNTGRLCAIE